MSSLVRGVTQRSDRTDGPTTISLQVQVRYMAQADESEFGAAGDGENSSVPHVLPGSASPLPVRVITEQLTPLQTSLLLCCH